MSFTWPRLGRFGSRYWRVWLCYYVAFVFIHVAALHGWIMVFAPNTGRPARLLGIQAVYA